MKTSLAFLALTVFGIVAPAAQDSKMDPGLRQAYERAIYSLKDSGHGVWRGSNDAQRLALEFDANGARLTDTGGSVGFHLTGIGYGDRLAKPAPAKMKASGTRLEYRRGDVTEWYENGRGGLEQGFTFAKRPGGPGDESLTIALGVSEGVALREKDGAILVESGGVESGRGSVLRYSGLTARDAQGRTLRSRLEAGEGEIRLIVEDRDAVYPVVVDPTWTQQQELHSSDDVAGDLFGASVSVSGAIAVIGAFNHKVGSHAGQGAAYVFVQSGSTWTQQQELTASDGAANDVFGYSVSVSGTIAVIGAYQHKVGSNAGQGAAYVFVQSGSTWSQQQELTASDGAASDQFGASVSVSGAIAVIGAFNHQVGSNAGQGAAYVFVQSGSTWSQQQELTASDGAAGDDFGLSVSVSGAIAVIAAPVHKVGSHAAQGAAYVFVQSGSTWTQQQELTASDGAASDEFGISVSVSGAIAVIGAFQHKVGTHAAQGAAYVFVQSGSTWSQQQELTASDGAANDQFAASVSVTGAIAVIGAGGHKVGTHVQQGAAYVFVQSGSTWSQQQELTASDGAASNQFGVVSVSGGRVLVGDGAENAYVFTYPAAIYSISATHSTPIFQSGQGTLTLTVTNSAGASAGAATISDTIDSAFTINSVPTGCSATLQVVTCTLASGSSAASTTYNIYVTTSATAGSSISNTATLSDSSDTIATGSSTDTIPVTAQAPLADTNLSQVSISGSTDTGACASGNHTLTASVVLTNNGTTLTNPYPANITLTQSDTLITASASGTSWANGTNLTYTFHITLATCNRFQLSFDVRSN